MAPPATALPPEGERGRAVTACETPRTSSPRHAIGKTGRRSERRAAYHVKFVNTRLFSSSHACLILASFVASRFDRERSLTTKRRIMTSSRLPKFTLAGRFARIVNKTATPAKDGGGEGESSLLSAYYLRL